MQEVFQFLSDRFHVAAWSAEDTQQLHQRVLLVAQAWCCLHQPACTQLPYSPDYCILQESLFAWSCDVSESDVETMVLTFKS